MHPYRACHAPPAFQGYADSGSLPVQSQGMAPFAGLYWFVVKLRWCSASLFVDRLTSRC